MGRELLDAPPTAAFLTAGLVGSDQEIAAFRAVVGAAQEANASCDLLPASPVPAASLSGVTAHSADMVVIDFGAIASGTVLTDNIPALYFNWLRPKTPVVIVDSSAIDVRPAVGRSSRLITDST